MLETLRIKNYALIDDLDVDFKPGFNVLTGETGAGKSIIVGALDLVLGTRASSDAVRQGADRAEIDAVFHIAEPSARLRTLLEKNDIAVDDHTLVLSRVVTTEGRSRTRVCGSLVPLSILAEIGDELVDVHGQHEHQSLLRADRQLDLLDRFGGTEDLCCRVANAVAELRDLDRRIQVLESDDREQARRIEFRRFEVGEINGAGLGIGEEEDLKARRNLIANAEQIYLLVSEARAALYEAEEGSAVDAIDTALNRIEELVSIDPCFQEDAAVLVTIRAELEEVVSALRARSEGIEFDPDELERLNQRIALIGDLKRKYGDSVEAILAYRDQAAAEIDAYESRDQCLGELRDQRDVLRAHAEKDAQTLSAKRAAAGRKLDRLVTGALQELGMKGGRFETQIEAGELGLHGFDRVAFLLAANPGESVKPLRQVASGGEVSRIMLALKAVFAHADQVPTLIFDEIDAGVGGRTATNVAMKLRQLADSHQTICITHIAQIAAAASAHYHVSKRRRGNRTVTELVEVEGDDRAAEVARLLDGSVSAVSLEHAKALLADEAAGSGENRQGV
ncbi:MAG TPA: DNA repair protein RecN [Candidatus Hydrogenedentes bacterium]|nr:DNA repair protein RecN [Candidatus Hydrogenedentota bacterium]HPG66925.1 DNA repair protein RecN [Candidatus Hydrogenedentota bacterium]